MTTNDDSTNAPKKLAVPPSCEVILIVEMGKKQRRGKRKFTLGESPTHEVFDQIEFKVKMAEDMKKAKAVVIILTSFLGIDAVQALAKEIRECVGRGVRVCLFIQVPDEWHQRNNPNAPLWMKNKITRYINIMNFLIGLGAHVTLIQDVHVKQAIVDDNILYDGSLNTLIHSTKIERMTRWESREKVRDAIVSYNLDCCTACSANPGYALFSDKTTTAERAKLIGKRIRHRRLALGMSQKELAQKAGIQRYQISKLEQGCLTISTEALLRVCAVLEIEFMTLPRMFVPRTEEIIAPHFKDMD